MKVMKNILFFVIIMCVITVKVSATSVYRVDDLKEGLFLNNDTKLHMYEDYINEYGKYKNSVSIIFLPDVKDKENFEKYFVFKEDGNDFVFGTKKEVLKNNSSIVIGSYEDVFGVKLDKVNGWIIKNIDAFGYEDSDIEIVLEPYYFEMEDASTINAYTICEDCVGNFGEYSWYKYTSITDEHLSKSFNIADVLNYENNVWAFNSLENLKKDEAYITFEFEAKKGDIISFDSKIGLGIDNSYLGNIYYELDGKPYVLEHSVFFLNNRIEIDKSGSHTLKFIVKKEDGINKNIYAYFKNIKVLTFINDEQGLAEGKLSGNEKIMYEAMTSHGVVVTDNIVYERSEQYLNQLSEVKNPETNSLKMILLIVAVLIGFVVLIYTFRKIRLVK